MSEQPTLIVTVGLPGSGKSTWALKLVRLAMPGQVVRVNRDSLRAMLHDGRYAGQITETQVTAVERAAIRACFESNADQVVIDDTNLDPATLYQWYMLARELDVAFAVRGFLDVELATCIERDSQREGIARVGAEVIRDLHDRWLTPATACANLIREGLAPFVPVEPVEKSS